MAALAAAYNAPTAAADPDQDILFCNVQRTIGIACSTDDLSLASNVCQLVWSGEYTVEELSQEAYAINPNLDLDQWRAFNAAAIAIYCPPDTPQAHA